MTAGTFKAFLGMAAALALLAACADRPAPRGSANQGVPATGNRSTLNAPYYTGADPDFRPRGGRSN